MRYAIRAAYVRSAARQTYDGALLRVMSRAAGEPLLLLYAR